MCCRVKEMGVLVAPLRVERGDEGVVIIGGSFQHRHHGSRSVTLVLYTTVTVSWTNIHIL